MAISRRAKWGVGIAVGLIIVAVLVWGIVVQGWFGAVQNPKQDEEPSAYLNATSELQQDKASELTINDLYSKYDTQYKEVRDEVIGSDPAKWDKTLIEKAAFLLVYSQRMKSYNLTHLVLNAFDIAEQSGVDVNNAQYGATKEYREQVRKEATAAAGEFDSRSQGSE